MSSSALRNICLIVEYEGTQYSGWQFQPNASSIQRILEDAIEKLLGYKSRLHVAGRTDAGVHALAQLASFKTQSKADCSIIRDGLNQLLPNDISILHAFEVSSDFVPRKAAKGKVYRYLIWNRPARPAILKNFVWHIRSPLDIQLMREAARHFIGRHDFSAFASSDKEGQVVHAMTRVEISGKAGEIISCEFEATGFAKHQVRIMVGTLVDVGLKTKKPDDVRKILLSRDRKLAGKTAPAHGLFLARILLEPPLAEYKNIISSLTEHNNNG